MNKNSKVYLVATFVTLPLTPVFAHTISIGYENSGLNDLTFWYGTYHDPSEASYNEGALHLVGPGVDTTLSYDLLTYTKPSGLADGSTNFYSASGYTTLEATNVDGRTVLGWQGKEFTNLSPGTYTFTYIPIPSPTQVWAPINSAILSSSVTVITADLDNVTPRLGVGMVFDETTAPSPLIFEGGTLRPTTTTTLGQVVSVDNAGGIIDTNSHDLTLTGDMDGRGLLTKTGTGTLFLNGVNTNTGGLAINGGVINTSADNHLGASTAPISFDGGTLQWGAAFDLSPSRDLTLNAGGGTLDTQNFNTTIAQVIHGSGGLIKTGTGTLTLSAINTYTGPTTINQGILALAGSGSIAASSGLTNNGVFDISQTTSGTTIQTLSGSGTTELGSKTLTISNGAGTYAGIINGTGSINVTGGTQAFTGNNTFSGGLAANGGTVDIGADANLGAGTLTIGNASVRATGAFTTDNAIAVSNSNSTFNTQTNAVTLAGNISGAGTLHKLGTGTLTLGGTNTLAALSIDQGALGAASAGNLGSGTLTINNGTLLINGNFAANNNIVLTNVASGIDTQGNELSLGGVLSGSGALNKTGNGALLLTGVNTFSGGLNISSGTLGAISDAALGASNVNIGAGTLRADGSFTTDNNLVLSNSASSIDTQGNNLVVNGIISGSQALNKTGSGTLTLGGVNTFSGGLNIGSGIVSAAADNNLGSGNITIGAGTLRADTNFSTDNAIVLNNLGAAIDTQGNSFGITGPISGSGGLNKTGAGILTLSGNLTHTGPTTINAGTLALAGTANLATSAVTNNGTLDISGTSSGAHVIALTGTGNTTLGSKTLTIDNASGDYAGALFGTGAVALAGGTQTFSGNNSFSGGLNITGGTLGVGADANLGSGAIAIGSGSLQALNNFTTDNAVTLGGAGSTIDTTAHDVTMTGPISGSGTLNKAGTGTLTLTGANTQNGINVNGGTIAFNSDAALGAPGSTVTIQENTSLRTLADMNITHNLFVNNALSAAFDTAGHNVEISGNIGGAGVVQKLGEGTLTLSGTNTQVLMLVQSGNLEVASQAAAGASGGDLYINEDGHFTTRGSMTITQRVHITGVNAFIDTQANDIVLTGAADGSDCLNKSGSGLLDMRAASSNAVGACIHEGVLAFNNTFTGNVFVYEQGTAGGSGQIIGDMQVLGTLSPGNSPGQLIVAGSVTQAPGSSYLVDIDGATPGNGAGHHDQIVLTGAGSVYTADGTIQPRLRGITGAANNTFTPSIGQTFTVVTAEGGVTGSYTGLTQPADGLAADSRFDVIYRSNDILLAVTPSSYSDLMRRTSTRNAAATGAVIDAARGPAGVRGTSSADDLVDSLIGLDVDQLTHTLQQLGGEVHADAMDAAMRSNRNTRDVVRKRLDYVRSSGAVDNGLAVDQSLWGFAASSSGHVGADDVARGYSDRSDSLTLGMDWTPSDKVVAGVAFSYEMTDIDASWRGSGDVDSYQALLYAAWQESVNYVNGIVSIGHDKYDMKRIVDLADGAHQLKSDASGTSAAIDIEAGRRYDFNRASIAPAVGVSYDRIARSGFTEDGAPTLALDVDDDSRNSVRLRAGARMQTAINLSGTEITPYANIFAVQEVADQSASISPTVAGSSFKVEAADPGRTALEATIGLNAQVGKQGNVYVDYNTAVSDNAFAYSVRAGMRYKF